MGKDLFKFKRTVEFSASLIKKIRKKLFSSNQRTNLIKKNILGLFILKSINILLDFLIVPLTLSYLTQINYGVWLTISSMVNWLNLFDLGLSHGYRNKLAIALSENDILLAKKLTSTVYILLALISIAIICVTFLVVPIINWGWILNTYLIGKHDLNLIIQIVFFSFSFNLTLKIITSVFLAKQMPFYRELYESISKFFLYLGILVLVNVVSKNNLLAYVGLVSFLPLVILLAFNFLFFNRKYRHFRPSFTFFDREQISNITGLGLKFFIIQLGAMMLFMTDNLIISHIFSPAEVIPYQLSRKYFVIFLVVFSIIITPYWSAITEAYHKGDFIWIRNAIKSLNKIWLITALCSIFSLLGFYPFLSMWIGDGIEVPLLLAVQWIAFVILQTKNNIYTFFLNGTGKITMQLITGGITFFINIPLSIFLAKHLNMGISGVLLATNCSILLYVITRKIQYNKIMNHSAFGLWDA